jgi:hypothetical protein
VNNLKAFLDLVIESSEGVLKNVILEKKKKYNFN